MVAVELVMCRSCGQFVEVLDENGVWEITEDDCPECGGIAFRKNGPGGENEILT